MSKPSAIACTWRGRPAWRLRSQELEAVVTTTGAHLAALHLPDEERNPLWQPSWPAAERPDPDLHGAPDGEGPVLAGACGSMLCCDRFGPGDPGQRRPFHGEAVQAVWTFDGLHEGAAVFSTRLPLAGLALRRSFRLVGDCCELTTTAEILSGGDRDIDWCEHITLGGGFLDGVRIEAGLDRVDTKTLTEPGDIAAVLAMPRPADPPRGDVWSGRVSEGRWQAEQPDWRRRLSVEWSPADFPWLVVWTEHRQRQQPPWLGRERARGLELSRKPFPVAGLWPEGERLGRPTRCALRAGEIRSITVKLHWQRI
jgi:hypothetical protein